jgi:hypothetical protein
LGEKCKLVCLGRNSSKFTQPGKGRRACYRKAEIGNRVDKKVLASILPVSLFIQQDPRKGKELLMKCPLINISSCGLFISALFGFSTLIQASGQVIDVIVHQKYFCQLC